MVAALTDPYKAGITVRLPSQERFVIAAILSRLSLSDAYRKPPVSEETRVNIAATVHRAGGALQYGNCAMVFTPRHSLSRMC